MWSKRERKKTSKCKIKILQTQKNYFLAAPLRKNPNWCKGAVLPQPLTKQQTDKCLTYEEHRRKPYNVLLCIFRALALHLHGDLGIEEEASKLFNLFLGKKGGFDPGNLQGAFLNDVPNVEDLIQMNIFLYDRDNVWSNDWKASQEKYWQTFRHCLTITLQQSQ